MNDPCEPVDRLLALKARIRICQNMFTARPNIQVASGKMRRRDATDSALSAADMKRRKMIVPNCAKFLIDYIVG